MRRAVSIYAVPIAALAIVGLMTVGAQAKSVKDFYRGKRITLCIGGSIAAFPVFAARETRIRSATPMLRLQFMDIQIATQNL